MQQRCTFGCHSAVCCLHRGNKIRALISGVCPRSCRSWAVTEGPGPETEPQRHKNCISSIFSKSLHLSAFNLPNCRTDVAFLFAATLTDGRQRVNPAPSAGAASNEKLLAAGRLYPRLSSDHHFNETGACWRRLLCVTAGPGVIMSSHFVSARRRATPAP